MNRKVVLTGIVLIVIAIIFGAFGAHGLKKLVSVDRLASFEVGVRYQIYHGLALLVLGLNSDKLPDFKLAKNLMIFGVALFSGSIYLLAIQEPLQMSLRFLGPVTPIGGVLLITSWVILMLKIVKSKN